MSEQPLHKLYIETVGCQMNMLDSEMVVASLRSRGYTLTDNTKDADTILFNTCPTNAGGPRCLRQFT